MFFLSGVAKYLFVPLAEAVIFAMLASYMWSRTIVPTMAMYCLSSEDEYHADERAGEKMGLFRRYQQAFERGFERFRAAYRRSSPPPCTTVLSSPRVSWPSVSSPRDSLFFSAAISFLAWTPARFACTCAPAPACALKRPPG